MAAVDPDLHVPVREGDYGTKVATLEPGGVEFIALSERHGKPIHLFWTWLSPNLEFATIFVGVFAVSLLGLNIPESISAIVVGTLLGSITHGILSSWGPRFGVPMMVLGRAPFGFLGNILPSGLNAFTGSIGWFIVNSVSGAFAIQALTGGAFAFWLAFLIIVIAQVAIAAFGHNLIHLFERYSLPLLGIVFLIACYFIFSHGSYGVGFNGKAPLAFGGETGGWIVAMTAAFGYAVGWNPYATDYTRYLPPTTNTRMVAIWAGLGVFLSCVLLESAGAVLVTVAGTKWGPTDIPTQQLNQAMPSAIYYLTLLCIAIGAVCANVINIYSGVMSFLTLGIREMGLTLRQRRAILAVIAGVLGYLIGVFGQANVGPGTKYESFLLVIAYWIAPWLAVMFTDYVMRKGQYVEEVFYDTKHNPWQGFAAMLIGLVVSIGLFSDQEVYLGPFAKANAGFGDLTPIVGFVLTAILYYVFSLVGRKPAAA